MLVFYIAVQQMSREFFGIFYTYGYQLGAGFYTYRYYWETGDVNN